MTTFDQLQLRQGGGLLPTMTGAGSAAGESGVSTVTIQFQDGVHFRATPKQHLIWFQVSGAGQFDCRIADRRHQHWAAFGQLSICPAGADCSADGDEGIKAILVAVDPRHLALAAAEESALEAKLV